MVEVPSEKFFIGNRIIVKQNPDFHRTDRFSCSSLASGGNQSGDDAQPPAKESEAPVLDPCRVNRKSKDPKSDRGDERKIVGVSPDLVAKSRLIVVSNDLEYGVQV